MITAKIICRTKTEEGDGDNRQATVTFAADYADGRNKEWALYTPGLSLTMGLKGRVADGFVVGQPYDLTFQPTEPSED